ncbi:murein hydrolase activator EnvC [Marinoscillum sp. 108]|uniref:murein hydrolase activator EnvC family protein n=1 Tax=Marinoscillum sp. 108 TaxID=2653151 RepID=UPI0012F2DC0F|nr:peptidoglycan DD-metalloendopeptidase family protein [Marinoscillum sp. 108]VXD18014.1 Septal ring factor EnvC (AmiA/AmiB activator) [Marinoscillum sp. 108]
MIVSKRLAFFGFFVLLLASGVYAQKTKSQLEQEKRENLSKIAEAEKILSDTESEKKATLGQLRALNQQIEAREGLISALNQEVGLLNGEINDLSIVVNALQSDLKNLKQEYAAMIYSSYKANHGYSKLTFLFSARTFNQLYMRLKYLEQYADARKIQARQIEEVSRELDAQRNQVEIKRSEQKTLLNQQLAENRKLINLKTKQSGLVQELTKKEKELKKELADRKQAVDRLDNLIAEIVRKELERSKTLSSTAIANEDEISASFESNKNKLAWPVSSGFISSKFGKHPHPVMKGIMQDNPGVDIQTQKDESVKSVYDGKVIQIAYVPGMYNVVILQHGEYYTVYSRLKEVNVKKGTLVKRAQPLGAVHTDTNGVSEVHFEVWKNYAKLNPEQWLSPK